MVALAKGYDCTKTLAKLAMIGSLAAMTCIPGACIRALDTRRQICNLGAVS
jgi:hypothetical protein